MVSVAIDGPAGAGKSTLARRLAAEMGYIYVDTGAMYRAIGLYALRAGKDPKDNDAVNALLPQIELRLASIEGEQHIYLKEEDVSTAIRTEAAGMAASAVGANPAVRAFLLELQRDMAKKHKQLRRCPRRQNVRPTICFCHGTPLPCRVSMPGFD